MIVENHQKDVYYFKEYPCYSSQTHLTQQRQKSFQHIPFIHFSQNTYPKQPLPKYFIDKYQSPHQMYWFEWTLQEVKPQLIVKPQLKLNSSQNSSKYSNLINSSLSQNPQQKYRCLYIAKLGQLAHLKLAFNSDPQMVGISQDFLYTIGGNQLIITQLWPQTVISFKDIQSQSKSPKILPKLSQVIHPLDHQSSVLYLDFIYHEIEGAICKVIYFHEKKGIYTQIYRKNQASQSSLMNKILDFSFKFTKKEIRPIFYQTLVPNILGIIIHNTTQFSLFNLTDMKPITRTRSKLDEWQINPHQPIIIKSIANEPLADYNDCLNIVIGQGENVEIFLYHIYYNQTAFLTLQNENIKKPVSEIKNHPIHMFTSGEFIDFEKSKLNHFTLIHLDKITHLENFIVNTNGIIYLGYQKTSQIHQDFVSDQIPITGFINYLKPYITHEILMQENKIWKEYKLDILRESTELGTKTNSNTLSRLLIPGRYENEFIQKTLKLGKISGLSNYLYKTNESLTQIHQRLVFEWRNQYKFLQFVIYKSQILVIRQNSISTLIQIKEDQFVQEKDSLAEQQVSYNQILLRGFSVHFDLEGDRYIDQENRMYHLRKSQEQMKMGLVAFSGKNYEAKLRSINAILENIGDEGHLRQDRSGGNLPYLDEQENEKLSTKYREAKIKIIFLSTEHDVQSFPIHQAKFTEESIISGIYIDESSNSSINPQQNYLELHISILSLRVKDVLSDFINTLKINYHSYYSHITSDKILKKNPVSLEQLQIIHLQHMYLVFVMEWILNVGTKYHLEDQYELLKRDLIEQFVVDYIQKFQHRSNSKKKGSQKTVFKFFKEDIQFHVNNVLSLLFRGLLKDIFPHTEHLKMENFLKNNVLEADEIPQQDLTKIQIQKINRNSNTFLLMMLKKVQLKSHQSLFIVDDLLRLLFNPLIFKPFNPNIQKFIPINKTFVYCILSMPIDNEEKKSLLASHMDKNDFLALLLLIQLENNCYLSLEQGLQVDIYQSNAKYFESNTIRLRKQSCCIIQDLILTHYKQFLFPSKIPIEEKAPQYIKSVISNPDFEDQVVVYNQNQCIRFIKNLFSSIQFRYLTAVLMHERDKESSQQGYYMEKQQSQYENKSIAETYRQLIDQVDLINQTYGCSKGTKIDRAFKKFYSNIHHNISKNTSNSQDVKHTNGNYPEMTGLGYKISKWELDIIQKLYKKHIKILRMEKKDTYQSISIIQQRLNLEYAMIKIYLYRTKLIIKQVETLTQVDSQEYVYIMKICLQGLAESLDFFRKWRADLSSEKNPISDEQVLQALTQIDQMQNSRVWDKNYDDLSSYEAMDLRSQEDWNLLGRPITSRWLKLLLLTFAEDSYNGRQQPMFTNYKSIEDVLMKILIVIKSQKLSSDEAELRKMFSTQQIDSLIQKNQLLRNIYNGRFNQSGRPSQNNSGQNFGDHEQSTVYQRSNGLVSRNSFTQKYFSGNLFYS